MPYGPVPGGLNELITSPVAASRGVETLRRHHETKEAARNNPVNRRAPDFLITLVVCIGFARNQRIRLFRVANSKAPSPRLGGQF
jgi:hypothetical protein